MQRARAHTLSHHHSLISSSTSDSSSDEDDQQPEGGRKKCIWDWPSIGSLPGASDHITPGDRTHHSHHHRHHHHTHHHHSHHHHAHGRSSAPVTTRVPSAAEKDVEDTEFFTPVHAPAVHAQTLTQLNAEVNACQEEIEVFDDAVASPASSTASSTDSTNSNSSESLDAGSNNGTSEDEPAPSSPVVKIPAAFAEENSVSSLRSKNFSTPASDFVTSSDTIDSGTNQSSPTSRRTSSESSSGYFSSGSGRPRRVSFAAQKSHPLSSGDSSTSTNDDAFLFNANEVAVLVSSTGSGGSLLSDCEEEDNLNESEEDDPCSSSTTAVENINDVCDSTTKSACAVQVTLAAAPWPRLATFAAHSTRSKLCTSNSIDISLHSKLSNLAPQHSNRLLRERRLSSPISDSVRQLLLDPEHCNDDGNQVLLKNHVVKRDLGDYVMVNQYRHKKSESLGHGVTSQVKLAFNEANKHYYAIKILQKLKLERNRSLMRRSSQGFDPAYREIAVLRKLCHPNIVKLVEVLDDPDDDTMFLVFELLRHGPVISIPTNSPLPEDKARKYFRDVVAGLHYLHGENIVHRDLKPDNMLVGDDGHVRLTDFGLSTSFTSADNDLVPNPYQTPAFVAPECLQTVKTLTSGRAIWSLGISLYSMVCGNVPFGGDCVDDLHRNICTQQVDFSGKSGFSHSLRDLILRLLEKDAAKRIAMPELIHHPWITKHGRWPLSVNDTTGHIDTTVNSRCHSSMAATPPVLMHALSVKSDSVATLSELLQAAAEKQREDEQVSSSGSGSGSDSITEENEVEFEEFDAIVDDVIFDLDGESEFAVSPSKRLCSPTFGRSMLQENVTVVVQRQRASSTSTIFSMNSTQNLTAAAAAAAARAARKRHCSNCSASSSSITINADELEGQNSTVTDMDGLGAEAVDENTVTISDSSSSSSSSVLMMLAESTLTVAVATVSQQPATSHTHKKNRLVPDFARSEREREKQQLACLICKRVMNAPAPVAVGV